MQSKRLAPDMTQRRRFFRLPLQSLLSFICFLAPRWYRRPRTEGAPSTADTAMRRPRSGGVIRVVGWGSGHQPNAGGRIMKLTRERLFGAPTVVRRAEERIERGRVAVSAARARATEIAQQCAAQPRLRPNGLQRRRLERLNGRGIGPIVKPAHGLR